MIACDNTLMRIMPEGTCIEDEIRRLKDAKAGELLYETKSYELNKIAMYEQLLIKADISSKRVTIDYNVSFIKL